MLYKIPLFNIVQCTVYTLFEHFLVQKCCQSWSQMDFIIINTIETKKSSLTVIVKSRLTRNKSEETDTEIGI